MNTNKIGENGYVRRTLSSPVATWADRIVVPLAGVGFLAATLVTHSVAEYLWPMLFFAILTALVSTRTFSLKTVELDGSDLIVSAGRHETRIPLSAIANIKHGRGAMTPIKIEFRTDAGFGPFIRFMPSQQIRFMITCAPHPVVNELKQLCGLTTGAT